MIVSTSRVTYPLFATSFLMLLGGGHACATVIFNSLDGTTNSGFYDIAPTPTGDGPLGASFLSGSSASTLTSVSVFLNNQAGTTSGSFSISLFNNSVMNTPGTLLETLASPSDSVLPSGTGTFTYSGLSYLLTPDTEYWIDLSGNSALGWFGTDDTSGIGVSGEYLYVDGASYANDLIGPQQMTITTTATPEPSSRPVCALGLLASIAVSVRRAIRASC